MRDHSTPFSSASRRVGQALLPMAMGQIAPRSARKECRRPAQRFRQFRHCMEDCPALGRFVEFDASNHAVIARAK